MGKMWSHPFHTDQWKEDEKLYKMNRRNDNATRRKEKTALLRAREAHGMILARAYSETDVLDEMRVEKRAMLEHTRALKALSDCEKSNLRATKVMETRRNEMLQKQKQTLQDALKNQAF